MSTKEDQQIYRQLIDEIFEGTFEEARQRAHGNERTLMSMAIRQEQMIDQWIVDGDWKKFLREWAIFHDHASFGLDKIFRDEENWTQFCVTKGFRGTDKVGEKGFAKRVWRAYEQVVAVFAEYGIDSYIMTYVTKDHHYMVMLNFNEVDLICAMEENPKKLAEILGRYYAATVSEESDLDSRLYYAGIAVKLLDFTKE